MGPLGVWMAGTQTVEKEGAERFAKVEISAVGNRVTSRIH